MSQIYNSGSLATKEIKVGFKTYFEIALEKGIDIALEKRAIEAFKRAEDLIYGSLITIIILLLCMELLAIVW